MDEENNEDIYESDLPTDLEQINDKEEAVAKREAFEKNIQNMWGYSNTGIEAKKAAMTMLSTKTGMYAKIPLICKSDNCPYKDSCSLLSYDLAPYGEPCPMETAQIEMSYAGYDKDFDLDNSSFTDHNLVLALINYDIMLERCKALIKQKDGLLIEEVFAGVSDDGEVYNKPEVSKELEVYERIEKKRNDIYNLMLATRKDKKKDKGDDDKNQSITAIINSVMSGNNNDDSDIIDVDSE